MIVGYVLPLVLAAVVAANDDLGLNGVDPNTLSCDPAGEIFLLLPHFTECNKFYSCAHGREIEMTCARGTIFDFPLQTCNHIAATKCWLREKDIEGSGFDENDGVMAFGMFEEEGNIEAGDPNRVVRSAPRDQFKGILNCQDASEASKHIAYKGDCQRYWRCVSGVPSAAYCTDGLYFNEQLQQCDFEANVKCSTSEAEHELDGEFIVYQ